MHRTSLSRRPSGRLALVRNSRLDHQHAAVDLDDFAVDEATRLRSQQKCNAYQVFNLTVAFQGNQLDQFRVIFG